MPDSGPHTAPARSNAGICHELGKSLILISKSLPRVNIEDGTIPPKVIKSMLAIAALNLLRLFNVLCYKHPCMNNKTLFDFE